MKKENQNLVERLREDDFVLFRGIIKSSISKYDGDEINATFEISRADKSSGIVRVKNRFWEDDLDSLEHRQNNPEHPFYQMSHFKKVSGEIYDEKTQEGFEKIIQDGYDKRFQKYFQKNKTRIEDEIKNLEGCEVLCIKAIMDSKIEQKWRGEGHKIFEYAMNFSHYFGVYDTSTFALIPAIHLYWKDNTCNPIPFSDVGLKVGENKYI